MTGSSKRRRKAWPAPAALTFGLTLAVMLGTTGSVGHASPTALQDEPPEQIINGGFEDGTAPWWWTENVTAELVDGRLCAEIPGATTNPWDAIIGQSDIALVSGESYEFSFSASASEPVTVLANIQLAEEPYTAELSQPVTLGEMAEYTYFFESATDTAAGSVQFQLGGADVPWTLCLDDVSLKGGAEIPPYEPDTGPRVRVNQVGYLPDGPKNATVVTEATEPLEWRLNDAAGGVVAEGSSTPRGMDSASGQNVHTIDFSEFQTPGEGYTLTADGETSHPFDIATTIYDGLRSDALQFFYIQRSGIEIDGSLVGDEYARPAGHLNVAPNQGDLEVPCQAGVCDYTLDVQGGWYDAGDHGKYVVNGGISASQLLGTWERASLAPTGQTAPLDDGTQRVPETGNGIPDILDEARWEVEFLLRMQVPEGEPLAGMAHHKIHDQNWTGLPLAPEDDPEIRELHPPSTAATLNLAATAAQCARVFEPYDSEFAARCLEAARTAWAAAEANPDILADPNDGVGGGAYSDPDVTDEFYWAAAELYLTTGEEQYLTALRESPLHTDDVFTPGGFGWPELAALARLQLATVPNGLPEDELADIRASVLAGADAYLETIRSEAYGLPMPGEPEFYFWGGNSGILNNIVVLATAYDLSGDPKYRDGAVQGMDYILGRNALNQSYVTGYGTKYSENQHSRLFGRQMDVNSPRPPDGSLAGGANAALQDPFAERLLEGCAPQFCYVDDIQSYSTNEVAINWNASLVWVASFLADQGGVTGGGDGGGS